MSKLKLKLQEKIIRLSTLTLYDIADTLTLIAGFVIFLFSLSVAIVDRLGLFLVPDFLKIIGLCMFPCGILLLLIGVVKKIS